MHIINTYADIPSIFDNGHFSMEKWKLYIEKWIPQAKALCVADMKECLDAGYSWQKDFLPILDIVSTRPNLCEKAVKAFHTVVEHLDDRIIKVFGKTVNAEIILYVGLCNGAGWVTEINGVPTVLLGLEKILELGWYSVDDMTGLIIHELGHIYQAQYGVLHEQIDSLEDHFLWQLFTEGVAMTFEQKIIGCDEYFHQNKNGWKDWCDCHSKLIKQSFNRDLRTMTKTNQRYFGDWVSFEEHGDTGYYLGNMFVHYLLRFDSFDNVIQYRVSQVREKYEDFMKASQ